MDSTGCVICDAGLGAGADELAAAEAKAEGMRRRAFLGGAAGAAVAYSLLGGANTAAAKTRHGWPPHRGRTLVLVTHDPALAGLADEVIELADGRVVRRRAVAGVGTGV